MSLEDLRVMGVLRDEADWDGRSQPSGVNVGALLGSSLLGVAGCVAMVLGAGGPITWLGIGGFLVGLFWFVGINLRGVGRSRRRRRS